MRIAASLVICALAASAQPLAFDAATVKLSKEAFGSSGWDSHPGSINLRGMTLKALICVAYQVKEVQVTGGPKWVEGERFDIVARAEGRTNDEQLLKMLQTLLADRFQLKFHREEKAASAYALVTMKSGMKIKPVEGEEGSKTSGGRGILSAQRITMAKLAEKLSGIMKGAVVDETGAGGVYSFDLKWSVEGDPADVQSALLNALQEQLGLKLESKKVPLDFLVIDQAEKPSDN